MAKSAAHKRILQMNLVHETHEIPILVAYRHPLRNEVVSHGTSNTDGEPWVYLRSCSAWSDDDTKAHVEQMLEWEPEEKGKE